MIDAAYAFSAGLITTGILSMLVANKSWSEGSGVVWFCGWTAIVFGVGFFVGGVCS